MDGTTGPGAGAPLGLHPLGRRQVLGGVAAGAAVLAAAQAVQVATAPASAAAVTTDPVLHLLRRATFGPTPALVSEVRAAGTTAWLDAQLAPSTVADSAMDAMATRWPRLAWRTWQARELLPADDRWLLMRDVLENHTARALFSRRQLYETAVDFWTNHLVVPVPSSEVWDNAHVFQRDVIRKHALGKYSDMLVAALRSPALLKVLDNADSSKKKPNENHGRELLELHTVGVGNFTEADVRMSALALTGLSVDNESGLYYYRPNRRHVGALTVLGWTHANTSPEGGEAVVTSYLTYLANHPLTATRIATKLATRYVSDTPPATLVSALAKVYLDNGTAIAPVLRALFLSPEFAASAGQKTRTPYEDALATARILGLTPEPVPTDGSSDLGSLVWTCGTFGQAPMGWPAPNGYPDVAVAWNGASSTLNRWNYHLGLAAGWGLTAMARPAVSTWLPATLPTTYGGLVDVLTRRLLITLTSAQREAVCRFVDHASTDPLTPGSAAVTWRLPYLVGLLLDSPAFLVR